MNDDVKRIDFESLRVISAVGRGAKGVVFLARTGDGRSWSSECVVALKVISKALIRQKIARRKNYDDDNHKGSGEYKRVLFEQEVLGRFNHPLFPRLRGVLETDNVVGFAIDYCHGGSLHSLRKKQTEKMFSDETIRFYAAELVLALEYLHDLGIVYRDLKPENVMIQENGHIMLVDFDLSTKLNPKSPPRCSDTSAAATENHTRRRRLYSYCRAGISPCESDSEPEPGANSESDSVEKSNSFVGTEEYVAPEIVCGKGHGFGVDWWSLGVVLYEMLYGSTPFKGNNRKETFYRVLTKEPELTGEKTALRDLIRRLLEKDPDRRIRVDEIKGHDFFRGVHWDTVLQIARPPYIPQNELVEIINTEEQLNKIDVEMLVHQVFFPDDHDGKKNNKVEVHDHELSHPPIANQDFLIF